VRDSAALACVCKTRKRHATHFLAAPGAKSRTVI
jgi:hypothetical protein